MRPKYIVLLVLILLVVIVLAQNTDVVTFDVLIWKFSTSRSIFLAVNILIGVAIGLSLRIRSRKNHKEKR